MLTAPDKKDEWRKSIQEKIIKEEMKECTFRPQISQKFDS